MIPASRLSLGHRDGLLSMDEMFPRYKLKDITDAVDQRVFIKVPKGSQVEKSSVCIIGGQGSGKSVLLSHLYEVACKKYQKENINCIHTDDIRVALDILNNRPVQLVFIDDAMTNASSRQVYEQAEIIKVYNRSRHVYEDKLEGKPGLIIYVWAWQRFGELDPAFRQGDVLLFKTGIAEPSERRLISQFVGSWYTKVLWQIWDKINRGNNAIKSVSVARIASLDEMQGAGLYISKNTNTRLPDIVRSDKYFRDTHSEDEILEVQREKPGWDRKVECYILQRDEGLTQQEIADALGVSQGFVSKAQTSVKKLLEKK